MPGGVRLIYDPAIRIPFTQATAADMDIWDIYDRVTCPTLVLRGESSGLLLAETAETMTQRGPRPQLVTFAGVGHAPALMAPDQIETVRRFLDL